MSGVDRNLADVALAMRRWARSCLLWRLQISKASLVRRASDDRQLKGLVMAALAGLGNAPAEPYGNPRTQGAAARRPVQQPQEPAQPRCNGRQGACI
jgi:hypothetical protein